MFLKYSREAETQADIVGTQILSRAGYDPMDMANFFEVLRKQHEKEPGRLAQFISSHPTPANRSARVQQEARLLGSPGASRTTGRSPAASPSGRSAGRSMQQIASGQGTRGGRAGYVQNGPDRASAALRCAWGGTPSSRFFVVPAARRLLRAPASRQLARLRGGERLRRHDRGPRAGVVETGDGQQSIVYGVIVNHYDPIERPFRAQRATLEQRAHGPHGADPPVEYPPAARRAAVRRETDRRPGRALRWCCRAGQRSPGEDERVTVFARQLGDDHIIYALFIAPGKDYPSLSQHLHPDDEQHARERQRGARRQPGLRPSFRA